MTKALNSQIDHMTEGQSGGEVLFNEAVNRLDTACQLAAIDRDLISPPGSPGEGDVYLVAAVGTGSWTGEDGNIAIYYSGWLFITPSEGWRAWIMDEDIILTHDGTNWLGGTTVADLSQTISSPPTQAEVQAISDTVDALLGVLRSEHGLIK